MAAILDESFFKLWFDQEDALYAIHSVTPHGIDVTRDNSYEKEKYTRGNIIPIDPNHKFAVGLSLPTVITGSGRMAVIGRGAHGPYRSREGFVGLDSFSPKTFMIPPIVSRGEAIKCNKIFAVNLTTPKKGYFIVFLPFGRSITCIDDQLYYTFHIKGPGAKICPIKIRVARQVMPPIDIDKAFRKTLKRSSSEGIDNLYERG